MPYGLPTETRDWSAGHRLPVCALHSLGKQNRAIDRECDDRDDYKPESYSPVDRLTEQTLIRLGDAAKIEAGRALKGLGPVVTRGSDPRAAPVA